MADIDAPLSWRMQQDGYLMQIDQLKAENAELSELVAELYQCSRQVGCDHCGGGYRSTCSVLNRMRERGIEVER